MIYVSVINYGRSDDKTIINLYVGNCYDTAKYNCLNNYVSEQEWNIFTFIQHWENGILIKEEDIS